TGTAARNTGCVYNGVAGDYPSRLVGRRAGHFVKHFNSQAVVLRDKAPPALHRASEAEGATAAPVALGDAGGAQVQGVEGASTGASAAAAGALTASRQPRSTSARPRARPRPREAPVTIAVGMPSPYARAGPKHHWELDLGLEAEAPPALRSKRHEGVTPA